MNKQLNGFRANMPRVSKNQVAVNRAAITDSTSRLIRERGIDRVSVADAMAGAGMTHGGFYGHFACKDDLVAAACGAAFERSVGRWSQRIATAADPAAARVALIDAYVSKAARNAPSTSCPATTLAGDVARAPAAGAVRAAYTSGVDALVELLTQLEVGTDAAEKRRAALADFALMVGSVVLSRALQGAEISDEVLEAGRARLVDDPGAARARRRRKS